VSAVLAVDVSPECVRLRVLWYSLRAGHAADAPGAAGIDYARPQVQSSAVVPTVPHGFGRGHARDSIAERIAEMPESVRVTLTWYRAHPAQTALSSGSVDSILDTLAYALAPLADRAAWDRAAAAAKSSPRARTLHRVAAARAWARARLADACAAWGV